jgi:hypothetical protein
MKIKWMGLACVLLMAACSHHALRVDCDGPLRPINTPKPVAAATSTDSSSNLPHTSATEKKP